MSAPRNLSLAFPIVAGAALAPDEADACPQPYTCEDVPSWTDLSLRNAAEIPTDGVLVIAGRRQGEGDPLANISLEVTKDGQPIAGAFETTPHPNALVWRPKDPWEPGATYTAAGEAMNPGIFDYCGAELEVFGGDFTVGSAASDALVAPEFTATLYQQTSFALALDSIACCEGAAPPALELGPCYGYYLDFDDGTCGATESTGYFSLEIVAAPAATGPVADSLVYSYKLDDVVTQTALSPDDGGTGVFYSLTAPTCVTVEALDLGTGAVAVSGEQCFGQDIADQLGPKQVVPDLGCPLEQCAVMGNTWDKTQCAPFAPDGDSDTPTSGATDPGPGTGESGDTDPDEDGDKGCACDTTAAPVAPLLALPLLLARRRRRFHPRG